VESDEQRGRDAREGASAGRVTGAREDTPRNVHERDYRHGEARTQALKAGILKRGDES